MLEKANPALEKLSKLLSVKSIVTLALTIVFCILSVKGFELSKSFENIYLMIIAFYFGTQHERKNNV